MRIKDIKKLNKIMMIKFYILPMKEKNEYSYINILIFIIAGKIINNINKKIKLDIKFFF